jgi:hypothetical protein
MIKIIFLSALKEENQMLRAKLDHMEEKRASGDLEFGRDFNGKMFL